MPGFETIVRPVVFPNIRPQPTPSLPPADDPTKGMAVISGQNGTLVTFADSYSISWSENRPQESKRRYDEVRIYQQNDDGTVNKSNFVDVQVANRIWMQEQGAGAPSSAPSVAVTNLSPTASMDVIHDYNDFGHNLLVAPVDWAEILQRNQIKMNQALNR